VTELDLDRIEDVVSYFGSWDGDMIARQWPWLSDTMPALVARVREVESNNQRLRGHLASAGAMGRELFARVRELETEVARLRDLAAGLVEEGA